MTLILFCRILFNVISFCSITGSSISSISSRSETGSENTSISEHSDTDSLMVPDQQRMSLQFLTDPNEISAMEDLYQPILNWIDPDLHIIKVTDSSECVDNNRTSMLDSGTRIPSMAIMVFLHEEGMLGFQRIQTVKRNFEKAPWKFHHSEEVHRGAINPYPYNSQDFYYTSENLPLWAIRQVHYGKEHIRTVLFVSEDNWDNMVQFYKLLVGAEPDTKREDFCLFTVHSHVNFDIQLALKKLQSDTKPRVLENVKIQFRVNDISNIMPMFPNVCRPLSDSRWETTDNDGNVVVIETPVVASSCSDRSSVSDASSISGRTSIRMGTITYKRNRPGSTQSRKTRSPHVSESYATINRQNENVTKALQGNKGNKLNLEQYLIRPQLRKNKENETPRKSASFKNERNVENDFTVPVTPMNDKLRKIKESNIAFQTKIQAIAQEIHMKLTALPQTEIDINQNKVDKRRESSSETNANCLKSFYV